MGMRLPIPLANSSFRLQSMEGRGSGISLRWLGQPTVQLQPLLYTVQVVIRAASLPSKAVLTSLEYVQLGWQPRFSPRAKQVHRSLVSDCLVIRRHCDE